MHPNPQTAASASSTKPGAAILDRLLEAAGAGGQAAAGEAAIVEQTTPKELEVDVGGAKRRVPVDELVRAYQARNEVEASKGALQRSLAEMGDLTAARAFQERVAALSPAQQRKVLELLQGGGEPEPDEGDEIDRTLGSAPRSREDAPLDKRLQQRLDQHEQALQALAARENGRMQVEHKQTVSERVDTLMKQYPVFADEKNQAATTFAKKSIMTQILARRGEDPEAVVQEAAAELQAFAKQREDAVREEVGVPRQMAVVPKGGLKGGDLRSGRIGEIARALLNGRR